VKILIADDNPFYRHVLEAALTEWSYEVLSAADGEAAWDVLRGKDPPKLAILDWVMPGLDGLEVCRRVRAMSRAQPTYIILLTAKGGKENVITGLAAGADDYVSKPFDREELQARLQTGLRIVGLQANLADRVRELEGALSGAQKMEAVGRLAGGVAHDFNNLLTVILGNCDLLLHEQGLAERQRESIQMIKSSGERGATLTRQLLAFSRKQVLAPIVLQLNALETNLEKMLGRLIGENHHLTTSLDPDLWPVRADPGQLEQVIRNLVVNARDAMPRGGQITLTTANVEIGDNGPRGLFTVPPGPYVLLEVSDTGCGMDEPTQARIFEPFFTTKPVGKGTGLGLATVYGIVKQSGGYVQVESEPGRGTAFRIYLPPVVQAPAPADESRPMEADPSGHKETVLLVEDEAPVRNIAREILKRNNYAVLEACDGNEALRISDRCTGPIHLILTDVIMPEISGPQLVELLVPQRPNVKVLYVSGYTDDALVQVFQSGSRAAFLQKPFTSASLARKVREVLDQ
jgi:signal transduction histidine kinase